MLGDVNKLFVFKSLLTTPSNVLPLHLKQTFPPIIWIFTEGEGDGIKCRLSFKIFSTLNFCTKKFFPHWVLDLRRMRLFCPAALALQDGNYVVFPWRIYPSLIFCLHAIDLLAVRAKRKEPLHKIGWKLLKYYRHSCAVPTQWVENLFEKVFFPTPVFSRYPSLIIVLE